MTSTLTYHHKVTTSETSTVPDYTGYHWSLFADREINFKACTLSLLLLLFSYYFHHHCCCHCHYHYHYYSTV